MEKIINFKNIKKNYYTISDDGFIKNNLTNKLLKGHIDKKGYIQVMLKQNDNSIKKFRVHRLVAYAFINQYDTKTFNKLTINHIDCNKTNNNINNLEIVSDEYNRYHAKLNNLIKNCDQSSNATWNNKQVKLICKLLEENYDYDYIITKLKCSNNKKIKVSLSRIKRRISWTKISKNYFWDSGKSFNSYYNFIVKDNNRYKSTKDIIKELNIKNNSTNRDMIKNIKYDFLNVQRLSKPLFKNKIKVVE